MGLLLLTFALAFAIQLGHASAKNCTDIPIAVSQYWVVNAAIANYYQPGNTSSRGPNVPLANRRSSIFINGSYPGPTIYATKGDWVRIDVQNMLLSRLITVHWHGLLMKGTPWADGTGMVTSCPVQPMDSATYIWQADTPGTYFYHGHFGLEDEYGVGGPIVIADPNDPFKSLYDQELPEGPIMVREWWRDPDGLFANLEAFQFYGVWDGAVINGQYGDGSAELPYPVFTLTQGLCTRLRFINANTEWPGWTVSLVGANMTIIASDATNVAPITAPGFGFYIGQRMDAIICADMEPQDLMLNFVSSMGPTDIQPNHTVSAILRVTPNTKGTVSKVDRATFAAASTMYHPLPVDTMKDIGMFMPYTPTPPPQKAAFTWNTYLGFGTNLGYLWTQRGKGLVLSQAPPLFTKGTCDSDGLVYKTLSTTGQVVDIVVNNLNDDAHVIHLHGHRFWVLAINYMIEPRQGGNFKNQTLCPGNAMTADPLWDNDPNFPQFAWGCVYNRSTDAGKLNTVNPTLTDSVPLPPRSWAVFRVRFDNPGWWYIHCHINNHMFGNMGFLVNVAPTKQPTIPSWVNTRCSYCNAVKQQCGDYSPPLSQVPKCSTATLQFCTPSGY